MLPFPPAKELSFFVGQEFGQIELNPHSIRFSFNGGAMIRCEYAVETIVPDGSRQRHDLSNHIATMRINLHSISASGSSAFLSPMIALRWNSAMEAKSGY